MLLQIYHYVHNLYLSLLLNAFGWQGSLFPAGLAVDRVTVPLNAEVQLGDSLEEAVEGQNIGIPVNWCILGLEI